jgi:integrating conjugative element protein (TIGR03746 family)
MSSGDYLDALASERSHSAKLTKIIFGIVGLAVAGMWFASRVPKNIDLHVAPDIKAGDTIRVIDGQSPVPSTNAYGFAYYIWQQINRWQSDGSQDYGKQIYAMQFYLTPRCRAQLQTDMQQRHAKGELRRRTRQISEIPGFPYSENRVIREGSDAWTVLLDMQVQETFAGQPVRTYSFGTRCAWCASMWTVSATHGVWAWIASAVASPRASILRSSSLARRFKRT